MKLVKKTTTTYWKIYEYTTPGTYTLTVPKNTACKLILVGGGGGGSASTSGFPGTWTAAGGSAGMVTGSSTIDAGIYTIVVGEHGIGRTRSGGNQTGTDGGNSTVFGNIAGGGGGGKTYLGGMSGSSTPGAAGTATATTGFTGTNGVAGSTTSRYGTYGGGGAKGKNNGQDGYCKIELASDSSDYDYTVDETVCYAVKGVVKRYWKYINFVQPVLSANGTMGGDSFACTQTSVYESEYAWKAFDNNESTQWTNKGNTGSLTFYSPQALKVTNINVMNGCTSGYVRAIRSGSVYGSKDGNSWIKLKDFTNSNYNLKGVWNIDLTNNTSNYKYYKIDVVGDGSYARITELNITAQKVVEGTASDYDYYTDVLEYKGVNQ